VGRAHPHRAQGRRPGRPGRLHLRYRHQHVPVPPHRADLRLPHPRQTARQQPRRHRPRGVAPGRVAV